MITKVNPIALIIAMNQDEARSSRRMQRLRSLLVDTFLRKQLTKYDIRSTIIWHRVDPIVRTNEINRSVSKRNVTNHDAA